MGDGPVHYPHQVSENEFRDDPRLEGRFLIDVGHPCGADVFRSFEIIGYLLVIHHNKPPGLHPGGIWVGRLDLYPVTALLENLHYGTHQGLVAKFGSEVRLLPHEIRRKFHDRTAGLR